MSPQSTDFTPLIDLLAQPGTGAVRERRPRYVDLLPPCNHACPAGENIQRWLALAHAGRYRDAWIGLLTDNPLPAIQGRVCYHPCEASCNRTHTDSAVSIHAVERFLGDRAAQEGWTAPPNAAPSGKRVLVVGSGPGGLSAAYHLARLGHSVEVHEAAPLPGGMLRFGIPAYRLPREVVAAEIARIAALGVAFVFNHRVEDVRAEQAAGSFDAAFLAIGAGVAKRIEVPARDATRVLDALAVLQQVGAGERPRLGRRVVIYGGGDTAMDAARTARRLGAEDTLVIYRRDRAHMPAHAFELSEALEEGIKVKWLSTIRQIDAPQVSIEQMQLDANGRPQPTGRLEQLPADAVILALGQQTEDALLHRLTDLALAADGSVTVDAAMMTGSTGIFAGGDMVAGGHTVTDAIGHGKRAARHIDAYLRRSTPAARSKHALAVFSGMHLPIYSDAERTEQTERAAAERSDNFSEVVAGLSEQQARYEAQRCFSCGNCFECDQCYAACPEAAIEKLGPGLRYRFDYARCTGCAVCFETCPCHAIEMVAESTTN
jgi:NADPH-dependent glutamate synthase beta subunit-like oxidoreductase